MVDVNQYCRTHGHLLARICNSHTNRCHYICLKVAALCGMVLSLVLRNIYNGLWPGKSSRLASGSGEFDAGP